MNFYIYGGNEQSTHKYVSELLGKETIDMNTYGKSFGRSGNYSTNYQIGARELMTPDEVRRIDNKYAILFIRGERPIMDLKYDILKHPNIVDTTDGKAKAYTHGKIENKVISTFVNKNINLQEKLINIEITEETPHYEILTEEEIEKKILNKEILEGEKVDE